MKNKVLIAIAFFSIIPTVFFAQTPNLLPIKVDQKWGFIDTLGRVMIKPVFDNLEISKTDFGQTFYTVAENKKIGLFDANGQQILKPKYRRIRPLSKDYFAVIQDSLEIVVDRNGTKILDAEFQYVSMLNPQYFAFKKDNLWGLYQRNKGEILSPKYNLIVPIKSGKGYFKIMTRQIKVEYWGLVDLNGKMLFEPKYQNINILDDNKIVCRENDYWGMVDKNNKEILKNEWTGYSKYSDYFSVWRDKDNLINLFLHKKDTFLVSDKNYINFIINKEDSSTIYAQTTFRSGLLDRFGNEIFPPRFNAFERINDRLYKVKDGGWGLYDLEKDTLILNTEFTKIDDFQANGLAKIYLGDYEGFVTRQGKVVVLPVYEELKLVNGVLKAYDNGNVTIFKQNANQEFDLSDSFENVGRLRIGGGKKPNANFQRAAWKDPYKFGNYRWEKGRNRLWGLKDLTTKDWRVPPQYGAVKVAHKANLTLVYCDTFEITNNLILYTGHKYERFRAAAIFSHQAMSIVSNMDMVGVRIDDFENGSSTAAFISKNRKFGLIHKNGRIVVPATKLYIGTYSQGLFSFPKDGGEVNWLFRNKQNMFASSWSIINSFGIKLNYRNERDYPNLQISKNLWGYMDSNGKVIVSPRFFFSKTFADEGFVINKTSSGWGMIDNKGKVLIPFEYTKIERFGKNKLLLAAKNNNVITLTKTGRAVDDKYAGQGQFQEGFARVAKRNDKDKLLWGFINKDFEEVIPCQYKKVKEYENGIAAVYDTAWHFINTSGEVLATLNKAIREIGAFHQGLAWAKVGSTNYGYINQMGKFVIKPKFTKAGDFTKFGVTSVIMNNSPVIIDTQGEPIVEGVLYSRIFDMDENGFAKVKHPRRRLYGIINHEGKEIIPMIYDQISPFTNGIATVRKQGKSGFVDDKGKVIVEPKYDKTGLPSEGLIAVFFALGQEWHYIDYEGKTALKAGYKEAADFLDGYAVVIIKDEKGKNVTALIDKKGSYQLISTPEKELKHYAKGFRAIQTININPDNPENTNIKNMYYADDNNYNIFGKTFNEVQPFEDNLGLVITDNGWGGINEQGFIVIGNKYIRLLRTKDGNIRGKARRLYGLTDFNGTIVQPIQFDKVQFIRKNLYQVEKDGKIGYITENGEWIWEIQE